MPPDPKREETIFAEALMLPAAERAAFLERECAGDAPLRQRVEALIQADEQAGQFLEQPPVAVSAATVVTTTSTVQMTEKPGDHIDRYKLLQQIGEGGCGVVYMAEQEEPLRRRVALKVIKLGMDTKQVIARFEAERQALAMMDHPNIAKVLDAGATEAGRPYFVMELVRGIRITDYCDQNNLSTRERLELFNSVCQAIQHAHQKGIIHRDIKPSNILIALHDGVPVPKVIDFGIAKATQGRLTDKTLFTAFEQFIGTPAYMSPEQAELSGLDIDTRSDIYSLGVLLYELLTGKTPFNSEELLAVGLDEMRRTIREKEPVRPSTRLSTMLDAELTAVAKHRQAEPPKLINLVRGDLDWIVMKCLEKDRTRRYETANGLARDIQRHLNHELVVARPPSARYRFQKLVRRNRLAFAAAAAVLTALVLGVVVSTWQALRAQRNAQQVQKALGELELNLYAADIYLAQNAIKEGNYGLARRALLAHVPRKGMPDLRGFEWCYFWKLCHGDKLASWHAHSKVVNSVAVSPDGKVIASASWDHEAKLWDAASHRLRATFPEADTVAFSPDAQLLFTASDEGRVQVVNVANQERVLTFMTREANPERPAAQLAVSPTDSILAVCTDGSFFGGRGSVRLYNYLTGQEIGRLPNSGDRMAFSSDGKTLVTGSIDRKIRVWDVATRKELKSLSGIGGSGICSLAMSPNGRLLATTEFWSGTVRLWDILEGRELSPLRGHERMVWQVAFSPNGKTLASGSSDQTIRVWDVESQRQLRTLIGHASEVWSVAFSPEGNHLFSGSKDETVAVWPAGSGPDNRSFPVANTVISPPIFSPDGRILAAATGEGETVRDLILWEFPTAKARTVLPGQRAGLWFSADATTLLTLSTNRELHWWNLANQTIRNTISLAHKVPSVGYAAASSDGSLVAVSSGAGQTVTLWELPSGVQKADLTGQITAAGVAFSSDNVFLAIFGGALVEVWDVQSAKLVSTLRGHKDGVSCAAFSPDRNILASSSADNTVKLWAVAGWHELATLSGHREGVMSVAFSPDGKTLASACADGSLKLWHVSTRREIASFKPLSLAWFTRFSPTGRFLIFAPGWGPLKLLSCPSLAEIDAALAGKHAGESGR